jgi:hypothetical protein
MPEPGGTDTVGGGGGPPGGLGGDRGFGGNRDGGEFKFNKRKRGDGSRFGVDKARTKFRQFDPFSMTFSSGGGQFGSGRKSLLSRRDGFKFT